MNPRSILSNYIGSLSGLAVSKGLRFFAVVYCIRQVGDYTWGRSISTIALFSFLTLIMDQGLTSSPLLFRLRERFADRRLLVLISTLRLSLAGLMVGALYAFHGFVRPVDPLVLIYAFVLFPRALGIDWWFQRREQFQMTTYVASVRTLVFFAAATLFVHKGVGPEAILYAELASEVTSVVFAHLAAGRLRSADEALSGAQFGITELMRFSFPFLLISVLNTVQVSMDILLLKFFFGSETVAQYDIGMKIGFLYFFVGATIIQIIRPKLTWLYLGGNLKRMGEILRMASSMLLFAGSVMLIPSFYFSETLTALLFGKTASLTVFVFQWAAVWVAVSFMTMLCTDTLLSLGQRKRYLQAAFLCALVNIGTNLLLSKLYSGYGAIFAKIFSEGAFLLAALYWLPSTVRRKFSGGLAVQAVSLAAFLGIYELFEGTAYRTLGALIWAAICLASAYLGGLFSRSMLTLIREN